MCMPCWRAECGDWRSESGSVAVASALLHPQAQPDADMTPTERMWYNTVDHGDVCFLTIQYLIPVDSTVITYSINNMALRLQIFSYAHSPPLTPAPHLKYDLRKISNPPREMRQSYDGRSRRLKEFMSHDEDFVRMRDRAEREIMDLASRLSPQQGGEADSPIGASIPVEAVAADKCEVAGEDLIDTDDETDASDEMDAEEETAPQGPVMRVGCFCAVGRHRSVAFAEGLAALRWPPEWIVQIVHRDVDKSRLVKKTGRNGKERKGDRWRRDWPN